MILSVSGIELVVIGSGFEWEVLCFDAIPTAKVAEFALTIEMVSVCFLASSSCASEDTDVAEKDAAEAPAILVLKLVLDLKDGQSKLLALPSYVCPLK